MKSFNLPQSFLKRIKKIYPSYYEEIYATFKIKKLPCFRINYLKAGLAHLKRRLFKEGISFKELSFPPGAFLLKSSLKRFQGTEIYKEGLVYVQNLSSMLAPIVLSPQNEEKILVLSASQGEKTTHIASLAPHAEVVVLQPKRSRCYNLLASLKIQGTQGVRVELYDGVWARKKFPEYFDKILLDSSCSAEARFYLHNQRSFKYWKEKKIKEIVHRQKKLLSACFYALREGGRLVYATSTFSPEENEGVIDWFINKFKDKIEILPIELPLANLHNGLLRWKDKKFLPTLKLTKRVIPNEFMEGLFFAKLRKI